jgi:hypothetical protein
VLGGQAALCSREKTTDQFVTMPGQARRVSRNRYPLHLDSHAFVSAIPQRWAANLQGFLPVSASPVRFGTVGGRGAGQMAGGVRILFTDDPCRDDAVDFLVTPGLDRFNYALLSLRDLVRHFEIKTVGSHQLGPGGVPISLPALELIPR